MSTPLCKSSLIRQIILDSLYNLCYGYQLYGLEKDQSLKRWFVFVFVKDTSGVFLLHRRLGRVDGFTDAAQLRGEKTTGMN